MVTKQVPLEVQVRSIPAATIAYIRHVGPFRGDTALFRNLFERLFAWGDSEGLLDPGLPYLAIYHDHPDLTPPDRQRLDVALLVPAGTVPSGEVSVRTLDEGLFATVRVYVRFEDYFAQWDALVGGWLPGSGYQADFRPAMEFYRNDPETDPEGRFDVEICLPVRPV